MDDPRFKFDRDGDRRDDRDDDRRERRGDRPWNRDDRDDDGRDDDDRDAREGYGRKRFPTVVMLAGIIWMCVGGLGLLGTMLTMAADGANPGRGAGTSCCPGFIAFAFLYCGYQTVTGTATDTRGNAGGSILLGLLQVLAAGFLAFGGGAREQAPVIAGFIVAMIGGSLILAGILGLIGRTDYLEWRAENRRSARR